MNRASAQIGALVTTAGLAALVQIAGLAQGAPAAPQAGAPAPAAKGPDKLVLVYRAKKDLVARYKNSSIHQAEVQGRKIVLTSTSAERVTIGSVAESGNITFEQQTESVERTFNGQRAPEEDLSKSKSTFTIAPDGTLISMQEGDSTESKSAAREYVSQSVVFPATPVGVGDKWSKDFTNDDTLGRRESHADFEVLSSEMKGSIDTFKVKMEFREKSGAHPIHTTGTFIVEKSSGDALVSDIDIENEPGPAEDVVLAGKLHSERVSGSPFDAAASAASKAETKTIDDVVKGYDKLPGLFTIYRKKENGHETIYAEIKEQQLDKLMLLETTASTGNSSGIVAGEPIDDLLFKLSRRDDTLQLVSPNINFRADEKSPIGRAVRRSFADAILESFKIEAKQPDRKSVLINITDFFRGDIAQIARKLSSGGSGPLAALLGGGGGGYALDREKTYVAAIKSLPENLEVETQYHFIGTGRGGDVPGQADSRSLPIRIDYALFPLVDHGFQPRQFDPRVGYFDTEYQSFDEDGKDDPNIRYIYRWNLEKADPTAKLSPPKKPIVFWLDNAIPTEYRDAVREGLLTWNSAFEKIGIKDAIVVKQMPDNADWDHADMRYNTIRWVASPDNAYAVAQFRVNPLTGEILNANITVDANFTRSIRSERRHMVNPASYFDLADPVQQLAQAQGDPRKCDMAEGMADQAWFGNLALSLIDPDNKVDDKQYLHDYLRHVVCHEMGHIMGLRHNFIASTCLDAKELQQEPTISKMGIAASVMDYTPFNVFALKHKGVDFFQPGLGLYDYWAIQYGYGQLTGSTPAGRTAELEHIATRCNEPGLAYETDENADSFDPNVVRFDLGKDPLDYYQKMLAVSRHLLLHLGERVPKNGESYYKFTQDFQRLLSSYTRSASLAARYVGGLHLNRNFKGDPHERPTLAPIPAADQKRALQMIDTYILSEDAFTFPRSYYTKLTADPNAGIDIAAFLSGNGTGDFPIRDQFAGVQRSALARLFNPTVLKRIVNNEFKVGDESQALTLPYLFHSVGGTVWAELSEHKNIGTLHRQLQRTYVDTLASMVTNPSNPAPDDAKMLAWGELSRLKERIVVAQRAEPKADEYTRVHLAETVMLINRALGACQTIGGQASASVSPLQALLGGQQ